MCTIRSCVHVRVCAFVFFFVCSEANEAMVAAKGGFGLVVKAMRQHEDQAGVAEQGCGFIGNLAMLGGFRRVVLGCWYSALQRKGTGVRRCVSIWVCWGRCAARNACMRAWVSISGARR